MLENDMKRRKSHFLEGFLDDKHHVFPGNMFSAIHLMVF